MFKRIIASTLCIIMFMSLSLYAGARTLTVNGTSLDCYIENGITYVSVRDFAELYGKYNVTWDSQSKIAGVSGDGLNAKVYQGREYTVANDRVLMRDGINRNKNGKVYAPVTVLAEAVSADVDWNAKAKHVTVTGGGRALQQGGSYYNSDDLYWMSRIISAESKGESFMGKCAVGNVVLNRAADSQFPSTVKGVIFDTKFGVQFSPISDGSIYDTPTEESVMAAKAVLDGFVKSDRVLYFLNPRTATNSWIIKNRPFMFRLGNHDFYS